MLSFIFRGKCRITCACFTASWQKPCCEFLMTHFYIAFLRDVTCVTMLLFPCSDESNFHFSRQVKGMKRDVQPWMIRGDQPRVDLVGSRRGCRWINYNDTVNNMHRAVNRVDMVTVLEACSKKGTEKETCPKKNRFKKPIQQTCFMKRVQENCTCFTICCVTWEPSCWNSASREVVLCLASWSWPHPTRANTSAQCRRSMSCTEHLFHCTVSFSLLANSLTWGKKRNWSQIDRRMQRSKIPSWPTFSHGERHAVLELVPVLLKGESFMCFKAIHQLQGF